jgi:hypothetical protein
LVVDDSVACRVVSTSDAKQRRPGQWRNLWRSTRTAYLHPRAHAAADRNEHAHTHRPPPVTKDSSAWLVCCAMRISQGTGAPPRLGCGRAAPPYDRAQILVCKHAPVTPVRETYAIHAIHLDQYATDLKPLRSLQRHTIELGQLRSAASSDTKDAPRPGCTQTSTPHLVVELPAAPTANIIQVLVTLDRAALGRNSRTWAAISEA